MDLTIENRQIKPAVVNLFQFEDGTTTLNFTLDSYIHDDTVDLRNYKAYAVTSVNGHIDMTELESDYDDEADKLVLSWKVREYSLREEGHVLFQIVFKENADDGENTGVYHTYKAVIICRESIEVDERIVSDYPTLLKQWLDRINQLAGGADKGFFYIPYGETIPPTERLDGTLYWQWENEENTAGHFEDDDGNVLTFSQFKEKTKYLPNQDLLGEMTNSESADQHYITAGSAIKNAPIKNSYCLVRQYDSESTNRFIQIVQVPDGNNVVRTFVRCVTGHKDYGIEKVGEWRELATDDDLNAIRDELAPKASPAFTGTPTAPTPAESSNTTHISTTAWVKNLLKKYLPLTGGTITGDVTAEKKLTVEGALAANGGLVLGNGDNITTTADRTAAVTICSGEQYDTDPSLSLFPMESTTPSKGGFILRAGSNMKHFKGLPDGSLTWDGKNIALSVNGVNAAPVPSSPSRSRSRKPRCTTSRPRCSSSSTTGRPPRFS